MPQGEATVAQHLRQAAKTLKLPEDHFTKIDQEFPTEAAHVYEVFRQLNRVRGSNGYGPNGLTFQELHAWSQLMGVDLPLWEVQMLIELDRLWLKVYHAHARSSTP